MVRTIEIFLFTDALGLDIMGPLEVFTTASELLKKQGCDDEAYRPVFSAAKRGMIRLTSGLNSQIQAGSLFNKLHDWILDHLSQPLSIERLADRVSMSPRNFSRIFTSETGISPGKYVESLRLNRARELLESGDDTLETIAGACGFGRTERLRRVFQRQLRITPVEYRNHFKISRKGACP